VETSDHKKNGALPKSLMSRKYNKNEMKTLKLILITTIVITSMADVLGQSNSKILKRDGLRNKADNGYLKNNAVSGNDYFFFKTTGTYVDLTGAISVNNNQLWDDPEYVIPIGFDFDLYDITIDSLYFGVGLGGFVSSIFDENYEAQYFISAFETDLVDRGDITGISQSPISYKVEGSPGTRVVKVEWKNAGFYEEGDLLGTLNDYINFQLWLFEGSNDIEMHFGPNMITDPTINYYGETGAYIGLLDYDLTKAYLLSGDPGNPILVDTLDCLNGTPSNGTVYKFSKNTVGIEVPNSIVPTTNVYPNPTNGIFTVKHISGKTSPYQIIDFTGKVIQQGILTERAATIDLSNNASGVYLLNVEGQTTKLIKQ